MPVSKFKDDELSGIPWPTGKPRLRKKRIPWASSQKTAGINGPSTSPSPERLARLASGAEAETHALKWLQDKGLILVARNHRCKCGELDLIMAQGTTAVVVEVRLRNNTRHGSALESISIHKQQRISRCASLWWLKQGQRCYTHLRFDVVAIESSSEPLWVQNAWQISN